MTWEAHLSIHVSPVQEDFSNTTTEASLEEKSSPEKAKNSSENRDLFEEKPGIDHFKNEESDPRAANAMSKLSPLVFINCYTCLPLFAL